MASLDGKVFNEAKCIARKGGRFAFAVSLGRDCAVMLDLMNRLTDIKRHKFFHWSHYPELLPYHAKYLNLIKKRYGIEIDVHLWPEDYKGKQATFVSDYMERNGCDLAIFGYRMDESLQRRGMLNKLENGIDEVRKWAYPLRSFTKKTIRGYVNTFRVPLQIEYNIGIGRDMTEHRNENAYMLRHFISETDYQSAIRQKPEIEVDYVRYANDPEFLRRLYGGKKDKEK